MLPRNGACRGDVVGGDRVPEVEQGVGVHDRRLCLKLLRHACTRRKGCREQALKTKETKILFKFF